MYARVAEEQAVYRAQAQSGRIISLDGWRVMGQIGEESAQYEARRPRGAIIDEAQALLDAVDDLNYPPSFKPFIKKLRQRTYYIAGYHIKDGTDEATCMFSLSTWAEELGLSRQHLCNMRADLIAHHAISYTPLPEDPTRGIIAWNTNFTEWHPFQKGGKRPGAGRPKKNQSVYASYKEDDSLVYARSWDDIQSIYASSDIQSVYENYSIGVQNDFNQCTSVSYEASQAQDSLTPKETNKKLERNDLFGRDAIAPPTDASLSLSEPKPKPKKRIYPAGSNEYKIAKHFREMILGYLPTANVPEETEADLARWCNTFRLMMERDHRDPHAMRAVMDYLKTDSFWRTVILSADTFRLQYDKVDARRLEAKAKQETQQNGTNGYHARASPSEAQTVTRRLKKI